ncbi:hypothetical protein JXB02_00270 [Candidatus Woesearchaeota archaeon]|nr:hypothetical protein [Candidatus Woesearchaeota archaeon]
MREALNTKVMIPEKQTSDLEAGLAAGGRTGELYEKAKRAPDDLYAKYKL